MQAEALLDGLDASQRAAVEAEAETLCILAGAGSGKTRVLTRRIGYRIATGSADAPHVLALTFTRKAAGELSNRLRQLGSREAIAAGTFHAVAYAQLRSRWADQGRQAPTLLDRKLRVLGPLVDAARGRGRNAVAVQAVDIANEIEWAKARLVPPRRFVEEAEARGRHTPLPAAQVAELYQRYEDAKRKRGLVDFDDLLIECHRALQDDEGFAAAQRWRFRHLFVDEFQDLNPAQWALLRAWLGDRRDLCVVGDPNQAIFGWNGADPTYLTEFTRHFPAAAVVDLDVNYRSTPDILRAAVTVLGNERQGSARVRARRGAGAAPTVTAYPNDVAEARGVARRVRDARRPGGRWGGIAVLARTNAQLVAFQQALAAGGVPYRVRGSGGFLELPEVKDALRAIRSQSRTAPFAVAIADLDAMALDDDGADERRLSLEALSRLARDYERLDQSPSADGFAAWLNASVRADDDGGTDAVDLVTFHRSKGLEWPVVFVVGLEDGLVPIRQASAPDERAEERRLLYVALTRAEDELHCSWSETRTFGERTVSRQPSPWLRLIRPDAVPEPARPRRPVTPRAAAPVVPSDDPLLVALKAWRLRVARAADVPAFVVFSDKTLAEVAASRPRTATALARISGIGPVKVARWGEALLGVVGEHDEEPAPTPPG